jgi:hypothetical protein
MDFNFNPPDWVILLVVLGPPLLMLVGAWGLIWLVAWLYDKWNWRRRKSCD